MSQSVGVSNQARSMQTRNALIDAALSSLIEVGYAKTTGVEVVRRAGLTRGALQHHFPEYGQLLAAALGSAYDNLLRPVDVDDNAGPMERWVHQAHGKVDQPEFKAVIELWLGSQNDPELGGVLADAMAQGAELFTPAFTLGHPDSTAITDPEVDATYRTITEALVGLGLGRATNGGKALGHEDSVVSFLVELARDFDREHA